MALAAICVQCGKSKSDPLRACRHCGLVPETDYQAARALMFSSTRTIAGVRVGRDPGVLKQISAQVQGGRPFLFDPNEEQRVVVAYRAYRDVLTATQKRRAKLFKLVVAVAVAIAGLWVWLRYLR